jgi:uncharacterized protein (DUF3084 family)
MKATHHAQISELQNKLKERDSKIEQKQAKVTELKTKVRLKERLSLLVKEQEQNDLEKKLKEKERCLEAVTKWNAVKRSLICFLLFTLGSVLIFGFNML